MATRKRVWLNTPWGNYSDHIKRKLTQEEIEDYTIYVEENTHFDYGNFVNSNCISRAPYATLNRAPNYMVLYNEGQIESRWFVMDFLFISGEVTSDAYGSKYSVSLQRDSVVDFADKINLAMFKCSKGYLDPNVFSPLLIQPEGITVNEIKYDQRPIEMWDANTRWLTLFYDVSADVGQRTLSFNQDLTAFDTFSGVTNRLASKGHNWVWNPDSNDGPWNMYAKNIKLFSMEVRTYTSGVSSYSGGFIVQISNNGASSSVTLSLGTSKHMNALTTWVINNRSTLWSRLVNEYDKDRSEDYMDIRNTLDGQVVGTTSSARRIQFGTTSVNSRDIPVTTATLNRIFSGISFEIGGGNYFQIQVNYGHYYNNQILDFRINPQETSLVKQWNLVLPNYPLDEVNLGAVTIPFGDGVIEKFSGNEYQMDYTTVMSLATVGWTNIGTAVKDIQILPYCPSFELNSANMNNVEPSNKINLMASYANPITDLANQGGNTLYYAIDLTKGSGNYRFNYNWKGNSTDTLKMDSVTKKKRFVGNNHKGAFEVNPTYVSNGTQLSFEYTLRPFNTVYRLSPIFSAMDMYGGNYKDTRGLIWEGGFSLSQVTDAWIQYKLQNSTYESTFNRGIRNQEITNKNTNAVDTLNYKAAYANSQTDISAQRKNATIGAVMGGVSSVASIGIGVATGNPLAVVGGIMGAANTVAGTAKSANSIGAASEIADRSLQTAQKVQNITKGQQAEDLAYKKDIFALNNQAIMAQPGEFMLSKDYSILTANKAYIEDYDCTPEEKALLNLRFEWEGVKVDAIGTVLTYMKPDNVAGKRYLEGVCYQLPGLIPPIANAINGELSRGIYIEGGLFND